MCIIKFLSIVNGIDDSDAVILLLSEGTNDSPQNIIRRENNDFKRFTEI